MLARIAMTWLGWACSLLIAAAAAAGGEKRPNILFIMADDHAAHAISAYGSQVNTTPNIDRLAVEGVRFANCFATNAICTPSRAAILTGQYSHVNGVPVFNRFDASRPTVAKDLQAAGYATAIIGKWHLGSDPTGFDHWRILPGQGAYRDPAFLTAEGEERHSGHCTELITRFAIEWLGDRPKDKPFFLCVHHKAPHRPWVPDDAARTAWAERDVPMPATFFDPLDTRCGAAREASMGVLNHLTRWDLKIPAPTGLAEAERRAWDGAVPQTVEIDGPVGRTTLDGDALARWKYQRYMRDYLACVQGVDESVGALLAALSEAGILDETIVVYTSDQGFFLGDHGWFDKRFMYEESIRMPLLVRWPGRAKPGAVQARMALNIDFAPTFREVAGLDRSPSMQGRSLLGLLDGGTPSEWRDAIYYRYYDDGGEHRVAQHLGIRTDRWKLIRFASGCVELFDLANDPRELRNLADDPAHAARRGELESQLDRLKRELGDDAPLGADRPRNGL